MKSVVHWLLDRIPFSLALPLSYLYCRLRYYPPQEQTRRHFHLPRLDETDLANNKGSDTLFVLGSGPSINRISPERWRAIAAHDSVGFNYWLYHSFVPTFYFMECNNTPGEEAKLYLDLSTRRAADYADVPKIFMDLLDTRDGILSGMSEGWRHNLFAARTIPAVARNDKEFADVISYLKKRGVFSPQSRIRYLFKHCATLSTIVVLGAKLQYKNIVLCGVDLTSEEKFYQERQDLPDATDLKFFPGEQKHVTMTRYAWGNTPIDVVLEELRRQVLRPAGIELYVEHDKSALYPQIPLAPDSVFELPVENVVRSVGRRAT
jgi:hypothetical protein